MRVLGKARVSVLNSSDPTLRAPSVRRQHFGPRGMIAVLLMSAVAISTAGCAAAAHPGPAQSQTSTAASASTLLSPDAASACEGVGLDFAREYGPDAQLYSGRVTTESELFAPIDAVESPSDHSDGSITVCVYTDVPTSPSQPPQDDGMEWEYTVLGVKVTAAGTAELLWMGPTGSEVDASVPPASG